MPVRYIGRKGTFKGKFLFSILCNLKNFGVGRMVVRRSYLDRWPEPSYFVIKSAQPDLTHPELKRGHVICRQVFRGKILDDVKITSGYTPDWWLVPKDEESSMLSDRRVYEQVEVPNEIDMPPLLAKLYSDKLRAQGREVDSESLKLFLRIRQGPLNRAVQPDKAQG